MEVGLRATRGSAPVLASLLVALLPLVGVAAAGTSRSSSDRNRHWTLSKDLASKNVVILVDQECPLINYQDEAACALDIDGMAATNKCLDLPFAKQPRLQDRKHAMQRTMYMAIFRRFAAKLREYGFSLKTKYTQDFLGSPGSKSAAQIVILADYTLPEVAFVKGMPDARFVVVQTTDSATVPRLACVMDDARMLALLQHTSHTPIEENNGPLVMGERLYAWMDPMNTSIHLRNPQLSAESLAKIHTVIPYVARYKYPLDCGGRKWHLKIKDAFTSPRADWLLPLEDRDIDIMVVAPLNPLYPGTLNEHRVMALEMVEYLELRHQLKIKTFQRLPPTREFYELAQKAKIIVSPFGLGEAVGKDYETILSGAVLVKPYSQRLRSSPDLYNTGYSVSCRADFSDLEHVVLAVLGHLKKAQSLVDTAYSKLVKESSDDLMVSKLALALKTAMESPAARKKLKADTFCKPDPGATPDSDRLMV